MLIAKVFVTGVSAHARIMSEIPKGISGATIEFDFSDVWDGLSKTVVFWGCKKKDVLNARTIVEVPKEVVEEAGGRLRVGVYGTAYDGDSAIPTLWCDLGKIQDAADPSGDSTTNPSLPVWAQILKDIGDLSELQTEAKDNLVNAINQIYAYNAENGATFTPHLSADGILSWTNDKGLPNPEPIDLTGPQGEPGSRGNGFLVYPGNESEGEIPISEIISPDNYTLAKGDLVLCGDGAVSRIADFYDEGAMTGTPTGITHAVLNPVGVILMGKDGTTPVRGTDYWTDEDKAEIVDETVAEVIAETILPETSLYKGMDGSVYDSMEEMLLFNIQKQIVAREEYNVTINGVTYTATATVEQYEDGRSNICLDVGGYSVYYNKDGLTFNDSYNCGVFHADIVEGRTVTVSITHPRFKNGKDGTDGEGAAGAAIIDVVELPTENINEQVFYRELTGTFVYNRELQNTYTCHIVDGLPDIGEPLTTDMYRFVFYYNVQDESVYAYATDDLALQFGISTGWYPMDIVAQLGGFIYGGVITNILDDPMDDMLRLLLEYTRYSYKDGWTNDKKIGAPGTGLSAEIFNFVGNVASGDHSHAEGYNTTASGYNSHAEGDATIASGDTQHVQGKYNIDDPKSKYAHIVGNGRYGEPSNAHTLDWDGLGWFAGGLKVGGTGQDDVNAKVIATEDRVIELIKDAIKSTFPTVDLTATLDDGTTETYKLYGEAVTE